MFPVCVCFKLRGYNFSRFYKSYRHPVSNFSILQDQMLYHFLIERLQLSLGGRDPQNTVYTRTEELEVAALTLDILLATMQNSDCISDKIQVSLGLL